MQHLVSCLQHTQANGTLFHRWHVGFAHLLKITELRMPDSRRTGIGFAKVLR